jgi:hypothetical protein
MPKDIIELTDIKPGDIYEDTFYHPCLCVDIVDNTLVQGISLIDGSYPRGEEIGLSLIRKLSVGEAWIWRTKGPQDLEDDDIDKIDDDQKWWK